MSPQCKTFGTVRSCWREAWCRGKGREKGSPSDRLSPCLSPSLGVQERIQMIKDPEGTINHSQIVDDTLCVGRKHSWCD